ncbi:hypothetical protein CYMTET_26234, partial [Cymbomonas tetramitiformis]
STLNLTWAFPSTATYGASLALCGFSVGEYQLEGTVELANTNSGNRNAYNGTVTVQLDSVLSVDITAVAAPDGAAIPGPWNISDLCSSGECLNLCGFSIGDTDITGLVGFVTLNAGLMNYVNGTVMVAFAPPPPPDTVSPTTASPTSAPTTTPTTTTPTITTLPPSTITPTLTPSTKAPPSRPLAPTDTTLSPTTSPTNAPATFAPNLCATVDTTLQISGLGVNSSSFDSDTKASFSDSVADSAGVSSSQVVVLSVSDVEARRRRHLAAASIEVETQVVWYASQLANGTGPADDFASMLMNDCGALLSNASLQTLRDASVTATTIMGSGLSIATPSYPPPPPSPPPLCVSLDPCFAGVECYNTLETDEGYSCGSCPLGYEGDGLNCTDVDECAVNNGFCDNRTACINQRPGRSCGPCPEGFIGDGSTRDGCQDIDECLVNNGGCDFHAECMNIPGSHLCGDCPAGYLGDGYTECVDFNECIVMMDPPACDPLTVCSNAEHPYTCSSCPPGFTGSGKTGCKFAESCAEAPCDPQTVCDDSGDLVTCSECPTGFSGSGYTSCHDIDGCADGPCFPGVQCVDTPAPGVGFACGACPSGYIGEYGIGPEGCKLDLCPLGAACSRDPLVTCAMISAQEFECGSCPAGKYTGNGRVEDGGCVDVDECATNNPCDPKVDCLNLRGGVECGPCPSGFTGSGAVGCRAITGSCAEENGGCWFDTSAAAKCTDIDPVTGIRLATPECGSCPEGYAQTPGLPEGTACVDIDDCEADACYAGVACLDAKAPLRGFDCSSCPAGYLGDGFNIERFPAKEGCYLDVCFSGNGGCSTNPVVPCTNARDAPNGRVCGPGCPVGYIDVKGDATVCMDEPGCELYPCFISPAGATVSCTDLQAPATGAAGRVCGLCPEGYGGNGAECADIDECALQPNGGCFRDDTVSPPVVTQCTNVHRSTESPSGRVCSPCPEGYKGSGYTQCLYVPTCGDGSSTEQNGGCWVGEGLYGELATTCTDLPNQGGTECGVCPTGMTSADGTGAAGCEEVDGCLDTPCFPGTACADNKAFDVDAPDGRVCAYEGVDWRCPEGYKGDGVECQLCALLVKVVSSTVVNGKENRAGWQLAIPKTLQVIGQLTGLDSAECTNLQGTAFRWEASVSDGSKLVLDESNKAHTTVLTVPKKQLVVKARYVVSFVGYLKGNQGVMGQADVNFFVESLPLSVVIAGGDVMTGTRTPVTLDAETLSSDPDGAPGEMSFVWRCRREASTERCQNQDGSFFPNEQAAGVLEVALMGGDGGDPLNYTFTMVASKGDRQTVVTTRLSILQGGPPVPSITPLTCPTAPCKANPVEKLTLAASVQSDDPGHLVTEWSVEVLDRPTGESLPEQVLAQIFGPVNVDMELDSVTCLTLKSNRDLVVRPGVLVVGGTYIFTMTAKDRIGPSTATITVQANEPPILGYLEVQPNDGFELDSFRVTAIGWWERDLPLKYQVLYCVVTVHGACNSTDAFGPLIPDFSTLEAFDTVIPEPGWPENDFLITVRILAQDNLEARSLHDVNVTVRERPSLDLDAELARAETCSDNGDVACALAITRGIGAACAAEAAAQAAALEAPLEPCGEGTNATACDGGARVNSSTEPSPPSPPPPPSPAAFRRMRRLLSTDGSASAACGPELSARMLQLVGSAQGSLHASADSNAAVAANTRSVVATPSQLSAESQEQSMQLFDTFATGGTPVTSLTKNSVAAGLSSLIAAAAISGNASSQPLSLRKVLANGTAVGGGPSAQEQLASRTADVVRVMGGLGSSLLQATVPDEEAVTTSADRLEMKVQRTRGDLEGASLYGGFIPLGESGGVMFPPSISRALACSAPPPPLWSQRRLLNASNGTNGTLEELPLEEQVVDMQLLGTTTNSHVAANASASPEASGVTKVALSGCGGGELAVSDLDEAIEVVLSLGEAYAGGPTLEEFWERSDEPWVGRLECRFWSQSAQAYLGDGCTALPNPAPAGSLLGWRTKLVSELEQLAFAWEVGAKELVAGCEERFDAVLPAWNGTDAGFRKYLHLDDDNVTWRDDGGCRLLDNTTGCTWVWTKQIFEGPGCIVAPEVECLCTHLTDFMATQNVEVGEVGPPKLAGPSPAQMSLSADDILNSVVLLSIVGGLMGMGMYLAISAFNRDLAQREKILIALVSRHGSGVHGFKYLEEVVWSWSVLEEDKLPGTERQSKKSTLVARNVKSERMTLQMKKMEAQIVADIVAGDKNKGGIQMKMLTKEQQVKVMMKAEALKIHRALAISPDLQLLYNGRQMGDGEMVEQALLAITTRAYRLWRKRFFQKRTRPPTTFEGLQPQLPPPATATDAAKRMSEDEVRSPPYLVDGVPQLPVRVTSSSEESHPSMSRLYEHYELGQTPDSLSAEAMGQESHPSMSGLYKLYELGQNPDSLSAEAMGQAMLSAEAAAEAAKGKRTPSASPRNSFHSRRNSKLDHGDGPKPKNPNSGSNPATPRGNKRSAVARVPLAAAAPREVQAAAESAASAAQPQMGGGSSEMEGGGHQGMESQRGGGGEAEGPVCEGVAQEPQKEGLQALHAKMMGGRGERRLGPAETSSPEFRASSARLVADYEEKRSLATPPPELPPLQRVARLSGQQGCRTHLLRERILSEQGSRTGMHAGFEQEGGEGPEPVCEAQVRRKQALKSRSIREHHTQRRGAARRSVQGLRGGAPEENWPSAASQSLQAQEALPDAPWRKDAQAEGDSGQVELVFDGGRKAETAAIDWDMTRLEMALAQQARGVAQTPPLLLDAEAPSIEWSLEGEGDEEGDEESDEEGAAAERRHLWDAPLPSAGMDQPDSAAAAGKAVAGADMEGSPTRTGDDAPESAAEGAKEPEPSMEESHGGVCGKGAKEMEQSHLLRMDCFAPDLGLLQLEVDERAPMRALPTPTLGHDLGFLSEDECYAEVLPEDEEAEEGTVGGGQADGSVAGAPADASQKRDAPKSLSINGLALLGQSWQKRQKRQKAKEGQVHPGGSADGMPGSRASSESGDAKSGEIEEDAATGKEPVIKSVARVKLRKRALMQEVKKMSQLREWQKRLGFGWVLAPVMAKYEAQSRKYMQRVKKGEEDHRLLRNFDEAHHCEDDLRPEDVLTVVDRPAMKAKMRQFAVNLMVYTRLVRMFHKYQDLHVTEHICHILGTSSITLQLDLPLYDLRLLVDGVPPPGRRTAKSQKHLNLMQALTPAAEADTGFQRIDLVRGTVFKSERHLFLKAAEGSQSQSEPKAAEEHRDEHAAPGAEPAPEAGLPGAGEGGQGADAAGEAAVSKQLPLERLVGTALVMGYLDVAGIVQKEQMKAQSEAAGALPWKFPLQHQDFEWYMDIFKVQLSLSAAPGWFNRATLWHLVFLQQGDGSWRMTEGLATALAAGDASKDLHMEANARLETKEMRHSLPRMLRKAVPDPDVCETVWATALALHRYWAMPFGWCCNPRDLPSRRATMDQRAERFLEQKCATYATLAEILPRVHEAADEAIHLWIDNKLEGIRGLRRRVLGDKEAALSDLSESERRRLKMGEYHTKLVVALKQHPWIKIMALPCTQPFTRTQRILVEVNKLLVLLFISLLLVFNNVQTCCIEFKQHLGCAADTTSECWGKATCAELYQAQADHTLPPELYEEFGEDHPDNFVCTAFPQQNDGSQHIVMDQIWSAIIAVGISLPINLLLTLLFEFGGKPLVPRHWRKSAKANRKRLAADSGSGNRSWADVLYVVIVFLIDQRALLFAYARIAFQYASTLVLYALEHLQGVQRLLQRHYLRTRKALWFLREVTVRGKDVATALDGLEVLEQQEQERQAAEQKAKLLFKLARNEMKSVFVQIGYFSMAGVWAVSLFMQLVFVVQIREMKGEEAENEILLAWLITAVMENLVLHLGKAILLRLSITIAVEEMHNRSDKEGAVMAWYEGYIVRFLRPTYQQGDEEDMGGGMGASGNALLTAL